MIKDYGKTEWINGAKLVAIIAVLIDHTATIIYSDWHIAWASYFSVTVFVFLGGMTSFYSNRKHEKETSIRYIFYRIKGIIIPYFIATLFYQIVITRFWDFKTYLYYLVNFNISGHFYFIVFYIQLLIISPFLYRLIKFIGGGQKYLYILPVIAVIGIAIVSTKYTFVLELHGGAKYLFGESYLIVFFLGMLFANLNLEFKKLKWELLNTICAVIFVFCWYNFICINQLQLDTYFPSGNGLNPPSVSIIIYSLLVVWLLWSLFCLLKDCRIKTLNVLVEYLCRLGKYSLYIFLYHLLLLNYFLVKFSIQNKILAILFYYGTMIIIPIIGRIITIKVKSLISKRYLIKFEHEDSNK